MTVTAPTNSGAGVPDNHVTALIDGTEVSVPRDTLIIRAAEQVGIHIPRFCDHPLLKPVGACRQCLVEVSTPGPDGSMRPMPKPQPACAVTLSPGMQVKTQHSSPVADKAQHGVMEFLLINHPLDCPVCDKGGECPLQNQAMSNGRATSRFEGPKRTFAKPIKISTQVLLDRERCILCQRCTRFSEEIAGDPFIDLQMRGAQQQVGTFSPAVLGFRPAGHAMIDESGQPFASYFSGNTIQICPVGALTSAAYRFRARPFDLVSTPGVCESCSVGCAIRVDHRRGTILRRLAGDDPEVNEEWLCDKGRFAFRSATGGDRLTTPLIRNAEGELVPASWPHALEVAAAGLQAALAGDLQPKLGARNDDDKVTGAAVLTGGNLTVEDSYAYSAFTRGVLGSHNIDFRSRPQSYEEDQFLAAHVVGTHAGSAHAVTMRGLEQAPAVLLVCLEPEDESAVTFLRLRKAATNHGTKVLSLAPFASRGLDKMLGTLIPTAPGSEAEVLRAVSDGRLGDPACRDLLSQPGSVILVGSRAAGSAGTFAAVSALAQATGATVAWIPARAGERGALEVGALPGLLPGGRHVNDPASLADLPASWHHHTLPTTAGLDTVSALSAAAAGELAALVVAGCDPGDMVDPELARRALAAVPFLVSIEVRTSEVTELADVVFPVAPIAERSGHFLNWEGRLREFPKALESSAMSDCRVLAMLASTMQSPLGFADTDSAWQELASISTAARTSATVTGTASPIPAPGSGEAILATWPLLLGNSRNQDFEPHLAGTAHRPVARLSATTAAALGLGPNHDGSPSDVVVSTERGHIRVSYVICDVVDHVVWLPTNTGTSTVFDSLGVNAGALVRVQQASDSGLLEGSAL